MNILQILSQYLISIPFIKPLTFKKLFIVERLMSQ